jgi:P pilus assembly chaperone PapD
LLLAAHPVRATFTIEPALITFFTDRDEKTAFVELVHTGGDPAAIQLSVFDRVLDIDGALVRSNLLKSPDFVVHPSQVILYPRERATVQIQYKGKGRIKEDRTYALYSQEVPIDVAPEDGENRIMEVKMLTHYYTVISLDTGKPGKLAFVSSKQIEGGKVEVVVENRGAGRVQKEKIRLYVGGKAVENFTGKSNSIMPGQQRRFTFEWPKAVTAREVKFSY